jgi:hypothetical protein
VTPGLSTSTTTTTARRPGRGVAPTSCRRDDAHGNCGRIRSRAWRGARLIGLMREEDIWRCAVGRIWSGRAS